MVWFVTRRAGTMLIAIFGKAQRDGRWSVRSSETVIFAFGSALLDFTQAVLPSGSISIRTFGIFGSVRLRVPAGSPVTLEGVTLLGSARVDRTPGGQAGDAREAHPFFVGGAILASSTAVEEG